MPQCEEPIKKDNGEATKKKKRYTVATDTVWIKTYFKQ